MIQFNTFHSLSGFFQENDIPARFLRFDNRVGTLGIVIDFSKLTRIILETIEWSMPITIELLLYDMKCFPEFFNDEIYYKEVSFVEGGRSVRWLIETPNSVRFIMDSE